MNIHLQTLSQSSRTRGLFYICVALATVASGNAYAQSDLNAIGGGGGGAFRATCAPGQLLSGFELRAGDYVDALRPLCVTATAPDEVGAAAGSLWYGGAGGGLTRVVCPAGKPIVTGMFVGTDADEGVVNNILLYCNVAAGTKSSGDSTSSFARPGPAGGISANQNDTQGCPSGQVATGVHGRSGLYLDAVGLICDAPRVASAAPDLPVAKSIGRVDVPSTTGPRRPICDAARDARARNSPAAPNLETQCLASKKTVTSLGKAIPAPANPTPASTPAPAETTPVSPSQPPAPAPPTGRDTRDAAVQALISTVVSTIQQSRDNPGNRAHRDSAQNIRCRRAPCAGAGQGSATQLDPDANAYALAQPDGSIRVQVRYPMAYGYKDAAGPGDAAPNSCSAFYVSAFAADDGRPREPVRIDTQAHMRGGNGVYVCEYLILDQPLDVPVNVRVAMSDQRAAGSALWLGGGSQAQPQPGARRTILDGNRQIVLTAGQPRAALEFEMIYGGAR